MRRNRVSTWLFIKKVEPLRVPPYAGFLCDPDVRQALREAIRKAQALKPFRIDAWVLLPDHLHCL